MKLAHWVLHRDAIKRNLDCGGSSTGLDEVAALPLTASATVVDYGSDSDVHVLPGERRRSLIHLRESRRRDSITKMCDAVCCTCACPIMTAHPLAFWSWVMQCCAPCMQSSSHRSVYNITVVGAIHTYASACPCWLVRCSLCQCMHSCGVESGSLFFPAAPGGRYMSPGDIHW